MSALPLSGKVAIVTGGSRSIGAAIAVRLGMYELLNVYQQIKLT
jgi:NADP-dependent 3-hydroxy acid dehydrogenase YdfG